MRYAGIIHYRAESLRVVSVVAESVAMVADVSAVAEAESTTVVVDSCVSVLLLEQAVESAINASSKKAVVFIIVRFAMVYVRCLMPIRV